MAEFELPENDFALLSISNTDTDTLTGIKNNGILRNLDSANSVVFVTESAGDGNVDGIIGDETIAKSHKLVLQAGQDVPIKNFRKLFARAITAAVLVQWIPLRTIDS